MKHSARKDRRTTDQPPPQRNGVDPMFDGHLETPLLKMTVQQRLDWIDETMRLRSEWIREQPQDRAT